MRSVSFLLVLLFSSLVSSQDFGNFINSNVNRNIDLTSQFSKQTISISLKNNGNSAASSFYLTFGSQFSDKMSLLEVTDVAGHQLKVSPAEIKERTLESGRKTSFGSYKVDFNKALEAGATAEVVVRAILTHAITPFPASIAQNEKQLVRYSDNHYFYSPYPTTSQITTVKLSSGNIESKTERAPTTVKSDTITYGSYADVAAFSHSSMNLHYENNKPFLTATKITKELEISHWGNLAVEVTYDVLQDDGATLKGTFSRYDYQRNPQGSPSVVPVFKQILPLAAEDIYYRDEIGNITSSAINVNNRGLVLDLVPRFPLFGGWKTAFYMGYNLPLHHYLFNDARDGSRYILNATFGVTMDDVVADELVVRVILPEGAKNVEVHTPFYVNSENSSTHYTYLDTSGRPVVIVTKKNVVSEHDRHFQVSYTFSTFSMFHEPFLLVGAFFTFFASFMAYVRINLRIGSENKTRSPTADRLDDILTRFRDLIDQRTEQHALVDASLQKLFKSKSETHYTADKKRIETALTNIKKEIARVIVDAEEVDIDIARRIRDLEKKQEKKVIHQDQVHQNEINYRLNKKIPKTTYEDLKAEYERLYTVIDEELESIVADLTESL